MHWTHSVCVGSGEKLQNTGSQATPARTWPPASELPGSGAELEEELEDLWDIGRQGRRTEHSTPRDSDSEGWRVTHNK